MGYIQKRLDDSRHDPALFRPERFLENTAPSSHWMPFGGGLHSCIGNHFALLEMRLFLKTLLANRDFSVVQPREERAQRKGILDLPARDLLIRCH